MNETMQTILLGLLFGTIGTTLGGIIGIIIKSNSKKFLSTILAFASGLMFSVVSFSLIPEALELSTTSITICGLIIGIIIMLWIDKLVNNKYTYLTNKINENNNTNYLNKTQLLKVGLSVVIGLAIHNIPEGLAIATGFSASQTLGFSLAIAICIHDIPERYFNGNSIKTRWYG